MNSDNTFTIFGYIGSSFLTIMMFPQVYLTLKTKRTRDISPKFLILNLTAVSFILPYGIHFNLYPVVMANISIGICNLILLLIVIKNHYSNTNISNNNIVT